MAREVICMLKTLLLGAAVVLLGACATSAPTQPAQTAAKAPPAGCVGNSATRLPVNDTACAGFGQSYSQQDLQRTGQPLVGPALQMLDPALTVHGH
jgi:hypothetical protein